MADIYENAFFTIAATCAANGDDGLRPFRDRFKALRLGSSGFFVRECIEDDSRTYGTSIKKHWPLISRGWAFQEGKLAPRTLRFSCHGVIWDYRTTRVEEEKQRFGSNLDDDTIDLLPFFSFENSTSDPEKAWQNTVNQYSKLDLTYRTDTLPAIAALAQRMARLRRNDTYLAGMWRSTLLSDIRWRTLGLRKTLERPRQESALPTWSWATKQGVSYNNDQHPLHCVEILSLDYTLVGPAEIGAIEDAILTIRGPTLPLQVHVSSSRDGFEFHISISMTYWLEPKIMFAPDYGDSPEFYLNGNTPFLALIIGSDGSELEGLILRQIGVYTNALAGFVCMIGVWKRDQDY